MINDKLATSGAQKFRGTKKPSANGIDRDSKCERRTFEKVNNTVPVTDVPIYTYIHYFVLWRHTQFLFNGFSSLFLCACVCCSVAVLTKLVAPPKMVYNWYRVWWSRNQL